MWGDRRVERKRAKAKREEAVVGSIVEFGSASAWESASP
jgi:hypothetical protein